ncbi:phosphoribosyltransferase family protein [Vibrio splendidus]
MGFKVDENGVVHVDETSHSFANTTVEKNPTLATTKCKRNRLEVYSLLLRTKNKTDKREIGDNCPLIYALKSKEGLSVTYKSFKSLVAPLNDIISKLITEFEAKQIAYDAIIPMPSSHNISNILANKLSKELGVPIETELFRKSNAEDIEVQIANPASKALKIPHSAKVNIMNAVKKARDTGNNFSMSDVKTNFRAFIKPLTLNNLEGSHSYRSVLLVDDLFATGSTLIQAKDELLGGRVCEEVRSVVLFSPLNGRIKRK